MPPTALDDCVVETGIPQEADHRVRFAASLLAAACARTFLLLGGFGLAVV
jgi:hypothetical protein